VSFKDSADLVRACRKGEAAGWDELLDRYSRLIWAVTQRSGLDADEAEEVFQRTWVAVVGGLHRLRDPGRLASWVAATARHQVYQLFSEAARHRRWQSLDEGDQAEPAVPAIAEEGLEKAQKEASMLDALNTLDERCRTLLQLLFFRDPAPDYREIAARTGLAVGSIGPVRARCLRRLRKRFEELYQEPAEKDS